MYLFVLFSDYHNEDVPKFTQLVGGLKPDEVIGAAKFFIASKLMIPVGSFVQVYKLGDSCFVFESVVEWNN